VDCSRKRSDEARDGARSERPRESQRPQERGEYGVGDASYRAAGERPGITKLVDAFYRYMDELPEAQIIRRMHPSDLRESRDKLARFLCGWMNGPEIYREKYGSIRIPSAHAHLRVGGGERDAWLLCMERAIADQGYAPDFAAYLLRELRVPAERVVQVSRDPLESG
jgi:hemoglobin